MMPKGGGTPQRYPRYLVEDRGFTTPCWTWQLSKNNKGYGRVRVDGREHLAHRHEYERLNGPIAEGFVLDHLCRHTDCVNPGHLEAVTQAENCRRGRQTFLTAADRFAIRLANISTTLTQAEVAEAWAVDRKTVRKVVGSWTR